MHSKRQYTGTVADWPLFFVRHVFGAYCFDTHDCKVMYNGFDHGVEGDTPAASSLSPERHTKLLIGTYADIGNFPAPADVSWTAKGGAQLRATVGFAEIFKDGLIRHNVKQDEIPEGISIGSTHIILEVDDRTINVYTRTMIPLKFLRTPGNPNSDFRDDLIKVYSRTY